MTSQRVGYSLVDDDAEDMHEQMTRLRQLKVQEKNLHWDIPERNTPGLRPGLRAALRSCMRGDLLVVPALDRLAFTLEDLENLTPCLVEREITLNIGGMILEPFNHVGRSIFETYLLTVHFGVKT